MDISSVKRKIIYNGPYTDKMITASISEHHTYGKTKAAARKALFKFFLDAAPAITEAYGKNLENYK